MATKYEGAIDQYTKDYWANLKDDFLKLEEWVQLCIIQEFLKPFHHTTLKLEGHKATLKNMLFTIDTMLLYFKKSLVSIFFSRRI
jgi:hypothetical protein